MVIEARQPVLDLHLPPETTEQKEAREKAEQKILKRNSKYDPRKHTPEALEDLKTLFGIWLGLPVDARPDDEKTQEQFQKKYGLTIRTLIIWKADPLVQAAARNSLKIFGNRRKTAIIDKLMTMAESGDVQAIKLYLEWQGEIGLRAMDKESRHPRAMELTIATAEEGKKPNDQ